VCLPLAETCVSSCVSVLRRKRGETESRDLINCHPELVEGSELRFLHSSAFGGFGRNDRFYARNDNVVNAPVGMTILPGRNNKQMRQE
jgi:hypothetical protein